VDKRQDPEKSTQRAARYLQSLYEQFGCWYLSAAGCNAGKDKMHQLMLSAESARRTAITRLLLQFGKMMFRYQLKHLIKDCVTMNNSQEYSSV
jgi:hypothetical protein